MEKRCITLSYHPPALQNGVFCPACLNFKHSLNNCPQVQYVPNREAVIKRHQFIKLQRKLDKSQIEWNARLMKDLIQQYASIFQNENQQSIINQTRILLNLECGSDSSSSIDNDAGSPAFKQPQTVSILQAQHEQQSQIKQEQLQIRNEQQNNQNELRQNLNNDLYNRKQSDLSGALGLGTIGLNKSPKNRRDRPIPLADEIKEFDSGFQNNSSDDSDMNTSFDYKKKRQQINMAIQDFNDNMLDNITNLYHQLQRNLEMNKMLAPICWSFNQQKFDDFETNACFNSYFNKQNAKDVILNIKQDVFGWQISILQRMRKFILYPYLYIQNFFRSRSNAKLKSITSMKVVFKVKRYQYQKKATVIRSSSKLNSVVPTNVNPFQQYKK